MDENFKILAESYSYSGIKHLLEIYNIIRANRKFERRYHVPLKKVNFKAIQNKNKK
jgi:hypothetical protein